VSAAAGRASVSTAAASGVMPRPSAGLSCSPRLRERSLVLMREAGVVRDPGVIAFRRIAWSELCLLVAGTLLTGVFGSPRFIGVTFVLGGALQLALSVALLVDYRGLTQRLRACDFPPGIYFALGGGLGLARSRRARAVANRLTGGIGIVVAAALIAIGVAALRGW
jgi:hypothetical protein